MHPPYPEGGCDVGAAAGEDAKNRCTRHACLQSVYPEVSTVGAEMVAEDWGRCAAVAD